MHILAPGGSAGGGCFPGDVVVWTPAGKVAIADIRIGDQVVGFLPTGETAIACVLGITIHSEMEVWEYKYWGGSVRATPNHWFLTEGGAFQEIGKLLRDAVLYDFDGLIRPLESRTRSGSEKVYNLETSLHSFLVGEHGLRVHNGGGGKQQKTPVEEADSGTSTSTATVVEAVSEGPVEGLIGGDKGILLARTPVRNQDGTANFSGFAYDFRHGTQTQQRLAGFASDQVSETGVGVEVRQALPITRNIIGPDITGIRVRIGVQIITYEDDGDVTGGDLQFQILLQQLPGPFAVVVSENIQGKYSSLFEREYLIPVNTLGGTRDEFNLRLQKLSADSSSQKVSRKLQWQSYSQVISGANLNYANTAVIALQFRAEQFNDVPDRAYLLGGRTVAIPTNAVVNESDRGLDFTGTWDGTFYEPALACCDPAWQVYDLLLNDRYGLGRYLNECNVDIYDLYDISRYNNEFVANGFGQQERRYRCSTLLQTREDSNKFIEGLLSACNAHFYWSGSCIRAWQDRPGDVTWQFTNADVEEGRFQYASSDIRTRYTASNVVWNDPGDGFRQAMEPVEDGEAIARFGYNDNDFSAYGCFSRGQAYRMGRHQIISNTVETETVNFKARPSAVYCRPGDIIQIADWKRARVRFGGLITGGSSTSVELDQPISIPSATGITITITLADLTLETRNILEGPGGYNRVTVSEPFSEVPRPGANWLINVIQPRLYRVLTMKVQNENLAAVEIVAGEYRPDKYAAIELGWALTPPVTRQTIPAVAPLPVGPTVTFVSTVADTYTLVGRWKPPTTNQAFVNRYFMQYRRGQNGVWSASSTVIGTEAQVEGLTAGTYYIRVASVLLDGTPSTWVESTAGYAGSTENLVLDFTRTLSAIAA